MLRFHVIVSLDLPSKRNLNLYHGMASGADAINVRGLGLSPTLAELDGLGQFLRCLDLDRRCIDKLDGTILGLGERDLRAVIAQEILARFPGELDKLDRDDGVRMASVGKFIKDSS